MEIRRSQSIIGIFGVSLALGAPIIQLALRPVLEQSFSDSWARFVSLWVFWIIAGIVLALSYYVEGIPLDRFGLKRSKKTLRAWLVEMILTLLLALAISIILVLIPLALRGSPPQTLDPRTIPPFWVMLPAWITAAFVEELLFRGYAIERLTMLTGRVWLAAVITIVAFSVLHVFAWGWLHVLTLVLPGSAMLTLVYLWRRSLWMVVIIHGIINLPLLLLPLIAPYL